MSRIISLGIGILLLAGLFSWPAPVSAGNSVWSAETIPTRLNNMLGPAGIDIRDLAIGNNNLILYAAPGDSITDITTDNRVVYKSTDGGLNWTALPAPIKADFIAIAPDDNNLLVIANNTTLAVYISTDGGTTWQDMGTVKDLAGAPAAAIFDIAISPDDNGVQYISVAGKEATGEANLWYFDYGAPTQGWHETRKLNGFATDNETAALAFSPTFSADATVVVVTDNVGATAGVRLQLLNLDTNAWNAAASYTGFPCAVVNNAGLNRLTSASLALAPTYQGDDPDSRKLFIGLTVDGNASANATSGIYRFIDTANTCLLLNTKIHSIAFNGLKLVAGAYDTTTVYRASNPLTTTPTPTVSLSATTKSPGGDNSTLVAWLGSSVIAATSGDESVFAKSTDNGATFDDISLIDTALSIARDVAISADGSRVYLVSENSTDTSLWRKDATWKRVFSLRGAINFIVRIEPSNANIVYLAKQNDTVIYYNSSGGAAAWLPRTCSIIVQDVAAEGYLVAYVINAAGSVSRTDNGGASWTTAVPTTLNNGATIVSVSTGTLLAGSQDGFVAYSTNSSYGWTKIPQAIEPGAGKVQVIADQNFATNQIIYAASDSAGCNIMKWTIGTSTAWTDIFNLTLNGGIYGLAINNNTLYALEYNGVIGQSTLWRHLSPATAPAASTQWTLSTTTAETGGDPTVDLRSYPRALKSSASKLWAVKTNGTNKLYSYSDVIINVQISLLQPAEGYSVYVNSLNGIASDLLFSWARPSIATEYELLIALDEDFLIPVTTVTVNMTNDPAYVLVGPNQAGNATVNFTPGTNYYWKIRTTKPSYSYYSASRSFSIESLQAIVIQPVVPTQGGMTTGTNPALSWQPLQGVTEYEFRLSDNPEMNSPVLDTRVKTTAIKIDITLEYGKSYFWQVRATEPSESYWSALVTFTVAAKPAAMPPPTVVPGEMTTGTNPVLSWLPLTGITEYQFVLCDNISMNSTIIDAKVETTAIKVNNSLEYGKTYFWRVRATQPAESDWSSLITFTVAAKPAAAPLPTVVPVPGKMTTGTNPAFSWQPLAGATEYQFMLSDNPEMTSPVLDAKVETTAIKVNITLEYGKTYFWQVRSVKPVESAWSGLMTFTVAEKPAEAPPPVQIEESPQPIVNITLPAPPPTVITALPPQSNIVTPDYLPIILITMLILLGIVAVLLMRYPTRILVFAPRQVRAPAPSRKIKKPAAPAIRPARPVRPPAEPESLPAFLKSPAAPEKTAPAAIIEEKSKEAAAVIFAAKSFMWMAAEEKGAGEGQQGLSEEERQSLGQKLAVKIQDLTRKENLFIKYPEDAALLLRIWARYGSRKETNRYLTKTFDARPDNAIRLLKCYLPAAKPEEPPPTADDFTMAHYDDIAEVVDPDKIYTALTRVFKFKPDVIEETTPVRPADRNLAFKFMRLHHEAKSRR